MEIYALSEIKMFDIEIWLSPVSTSICYHLHLLLLDNVVAGGNRKITNTGLMLTPWYNLKTDPKVPRVPGQVPGVLLCSGVLLGLHLGEY